MSKNKEKRRVFGLRNVVTGIIGVAFLFLLHYMWHPAVTVHNPEIILFVIVCAVVGAFALVPRNDYYYEDDMKRWYPSIGFGIIAALCVIILLIGWITTWKVFHSDDYRAIPTIELDAEFDKDFPEVLPDGSNIPYVDLETARHIGDRTIGKLNHASWYDVDDDYNLICYQGKYYRISPLNYNGFFAYNKAKSEGIPGYVLVNAETMSADFVKVDGGYFYSPSTLFGKNLSRHLRKQFPDFLFGKSNFEIDEEGHPYWVTAVNTVTVGLYGGYKESTFVITDAVSGVSELYSTESLPDWVDHGIGLSYVMTALNNYYGLIHGVFNFSKTDVYKTSYEYRTSGSKGEEYDEPFAGYTSFIDTDGEVCFYTGLTPANMAESNTGFLLINCKTGAVKQYLFASEDGGIEESTAVERAESEVQNYGYQATFPMMVNVAGEPTYLMCLKGKDGLVKKVSLALVSTKASTIVVGENLEDAINKYETKLISDKILDSTAVDIQPEVEYQTITGKIAKIYEVNIDGTTHLLYELEGQVNLFDSSIKLGLYQVKFQIGDTVTLTYELVDGGAYKVIKIAK